LTKKTSEVQDINKEELEKREGRRRRKVGEREKWEVKGNLRSNKQHASTMAVDEREWKLDWDILQQASSAVLRRKRMEARTEFGHEMNLRKDAMTRLKTENIVETKPVSVASSRTNNQN
jgi:hypothetical protein